jgi:predicted Co/Zn/Cd cation transporter (cation efflux family)
MSTFSAKIVAYSAIITGALYGNMFLIVAGVFVLLNELSLENQDNE